MDVDGIVFVEVAKGYRKMRFPSPSRSPLSALRSLLGRPTPPRVPPCCWVEIPETFWIADTRVGPEEVRRLVENPGDVRTGMNGRFRRTRDRERLPGEPDTRGGDDATTMDPEAVCGGGA
jgi:hypothetical protein